MGANSNGLDTSFSKFAIRSVDAVVIVRSDIREWNEALGLGKRKQFHPVKGKQTQFEREEVGS